MITNRTGFFLLLILFQIFTAAAFAEVTAQNQFFPVATFKPGAEADQLMWLVTETGGVPDGPFQGPMAFLTDKNGNFWIADTLNACIKAFDKNAKLRRKIDLIELGKKLKLASDPVMLDMTPGSNGRLLVADAANNLVIEVDVRGKDARVLPPASAGRGHWRQINRIHCDRNGKVYIEDLLSMRTVILNADGEPGLTLEGEVGIAIDSDGKAAMIVMDTKDPKTRHVAKSSVHGSPVEKFAGFTADKPVLWSSVIGFDQNKNLYTIFDTEFIRNYVVFAPDGSIVSHKTTAFPDPGYDPNRPDWISPDGAIYTVRITAGGLQILRLK